MTGGYMRSFIKIPEEVGFVNCSLTDGKQVIAFADLAFDQFI